MDDFLVATSSPMSHSSPKSGHEDSLMTEETVGDTSTGKSSAVSMNDIQEHHTRSKIDNISRRVQELVEKINDSRTSDQKVMDRFHETLEEKVTEVFEQMKERMYTVYEENSKEMQVKLQELSEVLDSCSKLNSELLEANLALSHLREGLTINEASEQ